MPHFPIPKMKNKQMYYYFITMLFCITFASAYNYQTIWNPFGNHLDYHITSNMSGENITADNFFGVVNSSDYWDNLNTINSTQLEDSSGELNIKESWITSLWCKLTGCAMTGDLNMSSNNIFNVKNYTGEKINVTCCVYLGNIRAYDGNSISVQPTEDTDDYFSFKTPASRPTIKREGGKFIYFESSNVYDTGISFRADATYSGTLNYEKDNHMMTMLGKNSPLGFKSNSEYNNYLVYETYDHQPQFSVFNGTKLKINDSLEVIGNINATGNLTNTNSWFLGKTAWATIQDKFITAVDDLYIYMSGTIATFNETKLNATIDNRAVTTETDPLWTANQSSYFTKANINSFGYYNSSNFVISNYYTKTNIDGFNFWNDTYATFNKTYADGLYADISVSDTNETTRFNTLVGTDCGAGNYSYGFDSNGLIQCREDTDTNTQLSDADILGLGYNHTTDIQTWVNANDDTGTDTQDLSYNTTTDVISLVDGGSIDITEVDTNTNANTICSGSTTYLDGEGNCDDISGVYIDETDEGNLNVNHSTTSGTATTWDGETSQANLNVNSSGLWDLLNSPADINAADITNDGTYRLNSWNNLTGIPHATPTNADVTHFSLADEIYDFVIALGYATTTYVDNLVGTYTHLSNYTDDLGDRGYTSNSNFTNDEGYTTNTGTVTSIATTAPIAGGTITTTGTISLTACANTEIYKYNSTSSAWECEADAGTEYSAGNGITITGSEINHTDTSSQASSDNSGNTFIQDIVLDTFGHITSIVTSGVDFSSYTTTSGLVAILGNWSADKSSYWDTANDLDTVISDDEIAEGKIAFSTACGAGNHYYLNGNDLACEADDDTTYTAGNGIALTTGAFSVAGNTALTQNADGLSVTADGIGDTQLAYNTGQHLTTTSNPQFNNVTGLNCLVFSNGAELCGV